MRNLLLIPALIGIWITTSCGQSHLPDSGIEGQVLIGPICPVKREGRECPDQPYQAVLTVTNQRGKRIVQFQTDEDGRFKISLAPGEYILHPESPNAMPFASEQIVVVKEGMFTQVIVNYDSGIR